MKYFVIFLVLVGVTGIAHATHDPTFNHPTPFGLTDLPPLKQIQNGIALFDVVCSDDKVPAYKHDNMNVACVTEETHSKLINRGWALLRFTLPDENPSHVLCNRYDGKWHPEHDGCRGDISALQCSLMGGKFVDNLKICYNDICPENKTYTLCVTESTKTKLIERGWTGNAERTIPDIEPKFLSKTITEWKSMPREQLGEYHDNYPGNSFFSDLGRFLIKDAIKHEMEKHGIQNKYDDFTVYDELMLTSLPPHAGFSAVVNATDQKTYLLGGSVFGNVIENGVYLRELVFYNVSNSADSKDVELPYNKLLKTAPQVSISQDTDHIRSDPPIAIFDLEQSDSVVFHNDLEYLIRIQAYIPDDMDNTILKSGTISPNQTGTITFENIGMYEYDVLRYPDNDSGLWEQKGGGEIIAISKETKTLPLEEKLEIARSFLSYARDDIPFYSIGIGNGELSVGIKHSVEKSILDYQEYYEKRIPQWVPFEIPLNVE